MKKLTLLLLICTACQSENIAPILQDTNAGINLSNLDAGQSFCYLAYEAQCSESFRFTGDTLEVEIVTSNDTTFFEESFSNSSPNFNFSNKYRVAMVDDYLLITERWNSQLFNFYGNDTLFLSKQPTVNLTQNGCQLFEEGELFVGERIGRVTDFALGQIAIKDKKGVSCVPAFLQIDGYLIYDQNLNLSHVVNENGDVFGYYAISK
ncbi:MAG: hypothetical protein ACJA08_000985 [Cyclobacteriaceae bacterium]|jgi:hypothetical protein